MNINKCKVVYQNTGKTPQKSQMKAVQSNYLKNSITWEHYE